eukprot:7400686-Pyramimonas_sp.AAC.2
MQLASLKRSLGWMRASMGDCSELVLGAWSPSSSPTLPVSGSHAPSGAPRQGSTCKGTEEVHRTCSSFVLLVSMTSLPCGGPSAVQSVQR